MGFLTRFREGLDRSPSLLSYAVTLYQSILIVLAGSGNITKRL
jgi:hypothetical protein